jgi:Cu/Ag efflux protein CusF
MRLLVIVALVCGCGSQEASRDDPTPDRYTVRGRVTALAAKEIELVHEAIPAFRLAHGAVSGMESMQMTFGLGAGVSTRELAVGDPVEVVFEVHWKADPRMRITQIVELPPGTVLQVPGK